jgi:hypothetical protein
VWLWAPDGELAERFRARHGRGGWTPDRDALAYERFFAHRVVSDDGMVASLLAASTLGKDGERSIRADSPRTGQVPRRADRRGA